MAKYCKWCARGECWDHQAPASSLSAANPMAMLGQPDEMAMMGMMMSMVAAYASQWNAQPQEEEDPEEEQQLEARVNPYIRAVCAPFGQQSEAVGPCGTAAQGTQALAALQGAQKAAPAWGCKWCALGECWDHLAAAGSSGDTDATAQPEQSESGHLGELISGLRRAASSGGATRRRGASMAGKQAFGFRGDSLILTRADAARNKKFRSFKGEIQHFFFNHFGADTVDYRASAGSTAKELAQTIQSGPHFDVLCVGVGLNDLVTPKTWQVLADYPPNLDEDLRALASAVRNKSTRALILLSGAGHVWNYPPVWDVHIARAYSALVAAGAPLVPADEASAVMSRMPMSSDGMHFLHDDAARSLWAAAWVHWLKAYAGVSEPGGESNGAAAKRTRSRSRSRAG